MIEDNLPDYQTIQQGNYHMIILKPDPIELNGKEGILALSLGKQSVLIPDALSPGKTW
jgi:hypothetical protein